MYLELGYQETFAGRKGKKALCGTSVIKESDF